jgi:hypothetical protein
MEKLKIHNKVNYQVATLWGECIGQAGFLFWFFSLYHNKEKRTPASFGCEAGSQNVPFNK